MNTYTQVIKSTYLIMGEGVIVSPEFIEAITPRGLERAYRERVKCFHPDKAKSLGLSEEELKESFLRVEEAYQILTSYVGGNKIVMMV